ncbi:Uncharacterised protein [Raoultella terrigena]|uniref:Uncharacterized protein n=1 Tax=Raoultella terrigena TaxID=577 RepID=A0A3P8KRN0_RAOTE|nr:Uncharacterised protein [Raoultella terrigena]
MARVAVVALIAKGQYLTRFLPAQGQRDGGLRQQRRLEFDVLNAVKAPARSQQRGGVVHRPVELRDARQQRLDGKMAAEPEEVRVEVQDDLYLLRLCLMALYFMGYHEKNSCSCA